MHSCQNKVYWSPNLAFGWMQLCDFVLSRRLSVEVLYVIHERKVHASYPLSPFFFPTCWNVDVVVTVLGGHAKARKKEKLERQGQGLGGQQSIATISARILQEREINIYNI